MGEGVNKSLRAQRARGHPSEAVPPFPWELKSGMSRLWGCSVCDIHHLVCFNVFVLNTPCSPARTPSPLGVPAFGFVHPKEFPEGAWGALLYFGVVLAPFAQAEGTALGQSSALGQAGSFQLIFPTC